MFLGVFFVGILAAISPGPDFFIVMKNSLSYGRRIGIATSIGIALALFIHVTYTILGFTYIIQQVPSIFIAIKLAGSLYVLWLGFQAIRSTARTDNFQGADITINKNKTFLQGLNEGFLCNVLNPKAALFFLSVFSQFISVNTGNWIRWIYGLEIIFTVGLWFTFLSIVISHVKFRTFYARFSHWVDRCLGGILIYFAVLIVFSTLNS